MRIAPKGGYDFARKRDYRRKVWATFRDNLKKQGVPVAFAQAMLMPSLEGDEIETALNAGFRESNLHVVDREPAVVATLKRRYPKINTYGVKASLALQRMTRGGIRLHCANLDLCNKASANLLQELVWSCLHGQYSADIEAVGSKSARTFGFQINLGGEAGAFEDKCLVAVSMLRGREEKTITRKWTSDSISDEDIAGLREEMSSSQVFDETSRPWLDFLQSASTHDRHRTVFVCRSLNLDIENIDDRLRPEPMFVRGESYLSTNGQTMLWSIWEIDSPAYEFALTLSADMLRMAKGIPIKGASYGDGGYYSVMAGGYDKVAAHIAHRAWPLIADRVAKNPTLRKLDTMEEANRLFGLAGLVTNERKSA